MLERVLNEEDLREFPRILFPRMHRSDEHAPRQVGRYVLFGELAAGGMATVHFGRLAGPVGFSRTVAIKRLHPQFAKDPEFVTMFLDEARLCGRIRHPNVVPTLDVVSLQGEIFASEWKVTVIAKV